MAEKSFRDTFHQIFFLAFTLINLAILGYIQYNIKDDCACANDKVLGMIQPLDYISAFCGIGVILGIINIFINLNRGFSSLPLLGTFFNVGVTLLCLIQMYMISSFLQKTTESKCKEAKKCQTGVIKTSSGIFSSLGLLIYLIAFIGSILLVWV
jgi:hypothetical protein